MTPNTLRIQTLAKVAVASLTLTKSIHTQIHLVFQQCRAVAAAIFGDGWKTKIVIVHKWDWHEYAADYNIDLFVGTLSPTIDNDVYVVSQ